MQTVNSDRESEAPKRKRRSGWDVAEDSTSEAAKKAKTPEEVAIQQALVAQKMVAEQMKGQTATQASAPSQTVDIISKLLPNNPLAALLANVKSGTRVYVGSLNYDIKEADVVALFSSFGKITKSEMSLDAVTNHSKGYCFIEFDEPAAAEAAITAMDGFELGGRKIKVGRPSRGDGSMPTPFSVSFNPLSGQITTESNLTWVIVKNIPKVVPMEDIEKIFAVFGKLLKTSYVKLGKNSSAVYNDALIQFETAAIASSACAGLNMFELIGSKLVVEQISVEDAEILSAKVINEITLNEFSTVILENMVSVEEAEDPDFKEEVEDEAVKFGELSTSVEIVIDSNSKTVKVLLRYKNSRNARRSFKAMNGRTFGTNTVKALLSM